MFSILGFLEPFGAPLAAKAGFGTTLGALWEGIGKDLGSLWGHFWSLFLMLFPCNFLDNIFKGILMISFDFEGHFKGYFGYFFEDADFVKIVLPPTREPHSGGSRGSEKLTFSSMFWHAFLEADFSSIFIDFGIRFGSSLAPWIHTFDHHFLK